MHINNKVKSIHRYLLYIISFGVITLNSCAVKNDSVDYASYSQKKSWSHHYAFGSPSWDSFERYANNPVYEGRKGMEWPVNGYLFSDPASKSWFLYIGEYRENYQLEKNNATKDLNCVIFTSSDKGKTWTKIGDLFPVDKLAYGSIKIEVPDVMVIYAEGKYHMIFDWVSKDSTWENMEISGIGYAVADKPEGPFIVSDIPVKLNTDYKQKTLLDKYARVYAPMIVKREKDWVLLHMFDTSPARAWSLAASTAEKPEGPYGESKLVLNVEQKTGHPPLQEFYPAFMHEGYVYFPATSVAINRNYQSVYRVKIEDVTNPNKYELFSAGSFWHGINKDSEYAGIWGQTITGFVDSDSLYVMYPSKNKKNYGTINLAKAPWKQLSRDRGFILSAHGEKSFSYIKKIQEVKSIDADVKLDGTLRIVWDFQTPIDILNGWGKFSFQGNDASYKEIEINETGWKINLYDSGKAVVVIDSGRIKNWNVNENNLKLKREGETYALYLNNTKCWEGDFKVNPGVVGILLDPHSYLFANRFVVEGNQKNGYVTYGFYEALLSAGNQDSSWIFSKDTVFLYGRGAISKSNSGSIAKWNFDGKGFDLWSPKGPKYGSVNIYLDGKLVESTSLNHFREIKSSVIFKSEVLSMGAHTVFIESKDGKLPVDCIKIAL